MSLKIQNLQLITVGLASLLPISLQAGHAVSETNGKIEVISGNIENAEFEDSPALVAGSLTTPLAKNWGIQGDALLGRLNSKMLKV